MLETLAPAFAASLILSAVLCYFGLHVIMREVIFVDLALAQIAAMGAAIGAMAGLSLHDTSGSLCSLLFTTLGATIFAFGRFRDARIPQEAIIGMVYAVSMAATLLVLANSAAEHDDIEHLLVGELLFVDWPGVSRTGAVCLVVGALHAAFGRRFFRISASRADARRAGLHVPWWDLFFYVTFGVVVTTCVQTAGVLLVFSVLIVPAMCAMIFLTGTAARLVAGWLFGLMGSVGGLCLSWAWNLPTGASIVACLGGLFVACVLVLGVTRLVQRSRRAA